MKKKARCLIRPRRRNKQLAMLHEEGVNKKMKRAMRSARGQSTLEYILVIAVVLIALVAVTSTALKPAVEKMSNDSANVIKGAAGQVSARLGL